MVVNPPYGERLVSENLLATYKALGERLKHAFQGNEAWVISSNYDCFDQIGLKASARIALYNGDLDCEFRKFELFQGKYSGFRDEGNALQKDFAPLKRKSRLTGMDGEVKGARRERNNDIDTEMTPDDIASMKRRRELESYFKSRDNSRRERKPRPAQTDGERPAEERRKSFAPKRDGKPSYGGRDGKPSYGNRIVYNLFL